MQVPKPPLPDAVREMLARPNPCVLSTVRPDGQPVSVATWYLLDGERILLNMHESRRRLDYLRNDPRVSLTIFDGPNWYAHVSLQGRAVQITDDPDSAVADRVARHYTGEPFSDRSGGRVSAWVEIDRYHPWGDPKLTGE